MHRLMGKSDLTDMSHAGRARIAARTMRLNAAARAAIEPLEDRRLFSATVLSLNSAGTTTGNGPSGSIADVGLITPVISANGGAVAFASEASDLVSGDSNSAADVFVRDPAGTTTTLVSVNSAGTGSGNGRSGFSPLGSNNGVAISGNGRYVVFVSEASNLVANDTNGQADVFIRDLQTQTTTLVSVNAAGTGSANGRSGNAVVSSDGRYVAFTSEATNLVTGVTDSDGTLADVFLRDMQTGQTRQLSVPSGASTTAAGFVSISSDGQRIAFVSGDSLVAGAAVSADQVYVYDNPSSTVLLASVNSSGMAGSNGAARLPAISANGNVVAFLSAATDMVAGFSDANGAGTDNPDVFVRNLATNQTLLVSAAAGGTAIGGNGISYAPSLTADGRLVAFKSDATNLVAGIADLNVASDVFLRDTSAGATKLMSINSSSNGAGNAAAGFVGLGTDQPPAISADGQYVVFASSASDLIVGDLNPLADLYVRDNVANRTLWLSSVGTTSAVGSVSTAAISSDGARTAFVSDQFNLIANDSNNQNDVFAIDTATGSPGTGIAGAVTAEISTSLTVKLPSSLISGGKVKLRPVVRVNNESQVTVTTVGKFEFFLSTNNQLDSSDTPIATFNAKLKLKKGQSRSLAFALRSLPAVADGDYQFFSLFTPDTRVFDPDPSDNRARTVTTVRIAAPFVDLSGVVTAIPSTVKSGKRVTATVSVTNNGNIALNKPASIALTAIASRSADVALGTVPVRFKLNHGATGRYRLKFLVPAGLTPGVNYSISATFDSGAQIAESQEDNNSAISATTFTVV